MEELMNLVSNVGFPIAVCTYLMIRMESKLDKLNDTIVTLSTVINKNNN